MIGLPEVLEIISAVLKFPQAVLSLVRVLTKTPEEQHEDLMKRIAEEAQNFESSGRPRW